MRDRSDREARIAARVARLAALARQWSPHDHGASWIDAQLSRVPENDNAAVESDAAVGCVDEETRR